jgi:maltose-binding protein MalE
MKYFAGTDPAIGEYGAINEIWDKWFYKVYVGELEAKDAVREAARELDAKFHELGYW